MDRSTLLFGLSSGVRGLLGQILDLEGSGNILEMPSKDLDFYEIFCGAANLSNEMAAVPKFGLACISRRGSRILKFGICILGQ